MAKKRAVTLDLGDGYRLPAPLPSLGVTDPLLVELEKYLHLGGGPAEITLALAAPAPAVRALLTRYLARPEALDLGVAPWDQRAYDAMTPVEKRARSKVHRAAARAQQERAWGLFHAVTALSDTDEGRALARARFHEAGARARFEIARALLGRRERLSREDFAVIATLLDADPAPDGQPGYAFGAVGAVEMSPDDAWERLHPRLGTDALNDERGRQQALAVLHALHEAKTVDPRWGDALRPLLQDPVLGAGALWPLGRLALDASWVDALLGFVHLNPAVVNVWDRRAIAMIARVADARCAPFLMHALAQHSAAAPEILAGLSRCVNDEVRAAVRAWLEPRLREDPLPAWIPLAQARAILEGG